MVTALKKWAFLFGPLSRCECVALVQIGHALMTVHKSNSSNNMTPETHACHNLQPISGMSTGHSNNTFKQVCRHVLKLQQNIMNYVFLFFRVQWQWKLSLTFYPDTITLKNVQMAVIFTSLGHKILKLYTLSKDKKIKFIVIPSSYFSRPLRWW